MRVLQLHTRYRLPGGEDTVAAQEAELLRGAGHEVLEHRSTNATGARSALQLASSPWNPAAARAVRAAVRAFRPDVAHLHNTWFAMSPSVSHALARSGVPVIATLHNYRRVCVNASLYRDGGPCEDCVGRAPWPGVVHRCYRGSATASTAAAVGIALNRGVWLSDRWTGAFLVLNGFMREVLVRGGLPAERVVIKGNVVPDPGPRPLPPSQARTVVVLGRVEALKGTDVLVEAWRRARPAGLELLVVGDGPDRAHLEALAVPGVRFLGRQEPAEVRRLLLGARALALPSVWYEGQPMSVLEAMASGTPVLASRFGGSPELLAPLGPQWLVEPGDPDAWARALGLLATLPADDVDVAGTAARRRWAQDHAPEVGLRRLEAVYERMLA